MNTNYDDESSSDSNSSSEYDSSEYDSSSEESDSSSDSDYSVYKGNKHIQQDDDKYRGINRRQESDDSSSSDEEDEEDDEEEEEEGEEEEEEDEDEDEDDDIETVSDDTSREPSSASDSGGEEIDMGEGNILSFPDNSFFTKDGNVKECRVEELIEIPDMIIVMFFAPWCGFCQSMKPIYQQVSNEMRGNRKLYAVNCEQYPEYKSSYNINGFPTIIVLNKGMQTSDKHDIYDGEQDADVLEKWIFNRMKKQIIKKMLGLMEKSNKSFSWENVKETNPQQIVTLENKMVMFFTSWCGHCKTAKPIYEQVAKGVDEDVYAINCETYSEIGKEFDIEGFPTFCIISEGKVKSKYKGKRESSDMIEFLTENGYTKSKMEKETEHKEKFFESVKELTPEELDSLSDSLVMFFAPWCGHCVSTKPIYEELSKVLSYPIYAFNCDTYSSKANECEIEGFPTIAKVSKGKVQSVYKGQRSVEQIKAWLESK